MKEHKKLSALIVEANMNDELIDNLCVDAFIKYIQDKTIIQSGITLDSYVVEAFGFTNVEIDYEQLSLNMKLKLDKARQKGKNGWWNDKVCSISNLRELYQEHTQKKNNGNVIDLCNFAMFIYFRENN